MEDATFRMPMSMISAIVNEDTEPEPYQYKPETPKPDSRQRLPKINSDMTEMGIPRQPSLKAFSTRDSKPFYRRL